MKNSCLLFLILFMWSVSPLYAQNDFKLTAKRMGNFTLDDVGEAIVPTLDGGLIMAGIFDYDTGTENDLMLVRLDAAGNQVWAKTWLGEAAIDPLQMVATNHDHFVLLGTYGDQILLTEIDEDGNPAWFRLLDEAQDNTFASPVGLFRSGDHYTAVFNYDIFSPSNLVQESNVVLQQFDLNGELENGAQFRHPDDIVFNVHAAAVESDGTIGMVGRLWNGNENRIDGFYLTVESTNSIAASVVFPNLEDDELQRITTDEDGLGFFVAGYRLEENSMGFQEQHSIVARIGKWGAVSWAKQPPFLQADYVSPGVEQLAHTPSGDLYVLDYENDAVGVNTGDDIRIIRATTQGNPVEQMYIDYSQGVTQNEWVNQITTQGDNQILMVGRSFPGFMNEPAFAEITQLSASSSCADLQSTDVENWPNVQDLVTDDLALERPAPPSWSETIITAPEEFITVTDINLDLIAFCNRITSTGSLAELGWQLELAPNPVSDLLQVTLSGPHQNIKGSLFIHNSTGQLVWQDQTLHTGRRPVSLRQLPPGYYWLTYRNPQGAITTPFVKQ